MEKAEYKPRHAFLDLDNLKAKITSEKNPDNTFEVELVKVPSHVVKNSKREIIDEGGGWYSKGGFKTEEIIYEDQYLAIKDNKCLGIFIPKETKSGKVPLSKLDGFKKAKEIIKSL